MGAFCLASESDVAALIFDVVPGVMRGLRRLMRASAQSELSIPQWRVLAHVNRGVSTAADLAELQGVSLAAICKMVDALESRGLIERGHREGNRKQLFIGLSPEGRTLFHRTRKAAERVIVSELAGSTDQERKKIEDGLLLLKGLFNTAKHEV